MPDFYPAFTARYRIRYSAGQGAHTQTWRFPGVGSGPELAAAQTAISGYYDSIQPALWDDFAILNTAVALRGSDLFLPVPNLVVTGAIDSTNRKPRHKAAALSFVGRTAAGLRAVIYQYGVALATGQDAELDDFRLITGEHSDVDNAILSLISAGSTLCGNDGNTISWYSYANGKYNDYWLRKVRNGG